MEFRIGDRVRIRAFDDLPEEYRKNGIARMSNQAGTVEDRMYSEGTGKYMYRIKFDNFEKSLKLWAEDYLEPLREDVGYCYEFEHLSNVVVARLYEIKDDIKTEIAIGHGHIIHEGAVGVAQAASYALKRIYLKLGGEF